MADVTKETLDALAARLTEVEGYLHIDERRGDVANLEAASAAPGFWDDAAHARDVMARLASAKDDVAGIEAAHAKLDDALAAYELGCETEDEDLLAESAELVASLEKDLSELELSSWFTDELDHGDAIVTVTPGQGGLEAQDWCEMLFRMYQRYCDRRGWSVTVNDAEPGEVIGLDRAMFTVSGKNAYGMLRAEQGVHRLVRISPFNAAGKRQTSFASLDVMPDIEEDLDIEIDEKDLRIDTYRSSGAGGQHINKTSSAIRITHIPTGIVVQCQNERSQFQNKDKAMQMLKAKLYLLKQQENAEKISGIRGEIKEIGWGSQIRSYVMQPYTMVKDHRTNQESGNAQSVLDGNLDPFINAYLKWISLGEDQPEEN